jgi:hypothetical protein
MRARDTRRHDGAERTLQRAHACVGLARQLFSKAALPYSLAQVGGWVGTYGYCEYSRGTRTLDLGTASTRTVRCSMAQAGVV